MPGRVSQCQWLSAARAQGAEIALFDADATPSEGLPLLHPDFLD
jgi:hypothetical protein